MPKIKRTINGGVPNRKSIWLGLSEMNISPSVITATSSGVTFEVSLLENYDTFDVAQTSLATDKIIIPESVPVGTVMKFIAASALDLEAETGGAAGFNGGSAGQDIPIAAGALLVVQKISAANMIATQYASSGAVTAPVSA